MRLLFILFIALLVFVIGSMAYYYCFIERMKAENSLLGNHIDELKVRYKAEGVDKYYEGLGTKELVKEHKKILGACHGYLDDLDKLAELSCKENFILAVLDARGVDTKELVREHLDMETLYKNSFDHNVRIVSVKVSLIEEERAACFASSRRTERQSNSDWIIYISTKAQRSSAQGIRDTWEPLEMRI